MAIFYGWYIVIASVLIIMTNVGFFSFGFTAAFEPIANEFGWSYAQISFAASLRGIEVSLLAPVAGIIMDRFGPRTSVAGGVILAGLGMIFLSRIDSLLMYYISFLIIAAGLSGYSSNLLVASISKWFREKSSFAMGLVASGVSLGGLFIPVVTVLIDTFGWRHAIFTLGIGMWVIILPLSFVLRHKPEKYGYLPYGEEVIPVSDDNHSIPNKTRDVNVSAKSALTSKTFWIIVPSWVLLIMAVTSMHTHIMPYLSTLGVKRTTASFIASAIALMTIVGRIGIGYFGDLINKRKLSALAFALTSAGFLILCYTTIDRIWMSIIFILVYGTGYGGTVPLLPGLLGLYFGKDSIATVMGFSSSVMMIGVMSGAPFVGWVYDTWGSYQPAFYFLSGIVACGMVLIYTCLKDPAPK